MNPVKKRWLLRIGLIVLFCAALFYLFTPWQGTIWKFDPDVVARRESEMWKHYYEKRFVRLSFDLYAIVREQYRVSPWDAALIAWDVAGAAKAFQASGNRKDAEKAIPALEIAFRRLARSTGSSFDARRAATLELEWWQQRREHEPPETYARTIALVAREVYACGDDERIDSAALGRAKAMAFRDRHRKSGMTEADWLTVKSSLTESYRLFHQAAISDKQASR